MVDKGTFLACPSIVYCLVFVLRSPSVLTSKGALLYLDKVVHVHECPLSKTD
jgi:hypothetical protein